jgi:hypothetical protein
MNNKTLTTAEQLILIGKAENLFNENFEPKEYETLKYLIVREPDVGVTKMLLMLEFAPYEYHAQALLSYMTRNNIPEIIINGGGKVTFSPDDKRIQFFGLSYAFGKVCKDEVLKFATTAWPSFKCNDVFGELGKEDISISGELYSQAKVKYEAEHP